MPTTPTTPRWQRAFAIFRPSHRHTAFTATLLLMATAVASKVIGLVRTKYIAYLLGRSAAADAFNSAFQLPDMISYFLVGGAASITFVTMLTRYRDQGRDAEGQRAMSIILTTMALVLTLAIALAELFAPLLGRLMLSGFRTDPVKAQLWVQLTRILLPAQLCFLAGGVFGSILLVRKQFSIQAIASLIYGAGPIVGGLVLAHMMGVHSLAIGTVAGAFLGPFLLNAIGAHRAGMRYRPMLDWSNPGLHEWVRMSIPLMLGVSLVTADGWIMNYFASYSAGAISLLTYAKSVFSAPVAFGQAAGAASLPFLAALYGESQDPGGHTPFARTVNASVSRILAFSILVSAFMLAMALPIVDVLLRGGAFHRADSGTMAVYLEIFSLSLCFWSAQAIYSRSFYATGNTLTPMIAGTAVTVISLPVYWALYRFVGPVGLAIASDVGILLQTLTLAVLLHRRRIVGIGGIEYKELLRAMLAGAIVYAALIGLRRLMPGSPSRLAELGMLFAAAGVWLVISTLTLKLTGSALPNQILARFARTKTA